MSGGGGGKGGSQTQEVKVPEWMNQAAQRNVARSEQAQKIGYMPYYGPDVAAFTPTQQAAQQSTIGAAEAFGLVQPGQITAQSGMPQPQQFAGGVTGYSSAPTFEQALAELQSRRPQQVAQYNKLFEPTGQQAPMRTATSALGQAVEQALINQRGIG